MPWGSWQFFEVGIFFSLILAFFLILFLGNRRVVPIEESFPSNLTLTLPPYLPANVSI